MREKSRVVWALALAVAGEASSQTRMLSMRLVLGRHCEGPTFKYPSTGSSDEIVSRNGLVRTHQSKRAHTRTHIVTWRRVDHAAHC